MQAEEHRSALSQTHILHKESDKISFANLFLVRQRSHPESYIQSQGSSTDARVLHTPQQVASFACRRAGHLGSQAEQHQQETSEVPLVQHA